jgi:hypothetical protein
MGPGDYGVILQCLLEKCLKEKYCLHILLGLEHLRDSGLDERTVETERQPLLANGSETTFISWQRPRNREWKDLRC